MNKPVFLPLTSYMEYPPEQMKQRASDLADDLWRRRTVREYSDRPVPRELIQDCLRAALSAPSGANMQPWQFVAISDDQVKSRIRVEAEKEEKHFYEHRASREWLDALEPLGTNRYKPFLESAPWLIAVFQQRWGFLPDGRKFKHYYPQESVGLATGTLITAVHNAGLVSLTHTPSPMGFLNEILDRPNSERPFLLLVVGYPADDAKVPDIRRRTLDESVSWIE